jgi:hypothetical protein
MSEETNLMEEIEAGMESYEHKPEGKRDLILVFQLRLDE